MSTEPSQSTNQPAMPGLPQPGEAVNEPDSRCPLPPLGSDPAIIASTPPEILEAQRQFFADLPQMLRERPGQWVAYYGKHRLGFAKDDLALWQECRRQGYEEVLIWCIYPYPETDYISAL